jgi:hypothetical protein
MHIVTLVSHLLQHVAQFKPLTKPQRKFMQGLLPTLLIVRGKVNFTKSLSK